jgi:hypothetical protein
LADTRRPDLVGNFLIKVAGVKEVSVYITEQSPDQPTFLELLGDMSSPWPGFAKLKLANPSAQIIDAVIRRCPIGALRVARLPLHPNYDELRLLASQCPSLKRLYVDKPRRSRSRPIAARTWNIEDICGAFVHLEWLVFAGIEDSDIEMLNVSTYQYLSLLILEISYRPLTVITNIYKPELGDFQNY